MGRFKDSLCSMLEAAAGLGEGDCRTFFVQGSPLDAVFLACLSIVPVFSQKCSSLDNKIDGHLIKYMAVRLGGWQKLKVAGDWEKVTSAGLDRLPLRCPALTDGEINSSQ